MASAPTEFIPDNPVVQKVAPRVERNFWQRLLQHRLAQVGLLIIAGLVIVALFAPVLTRLDPTTQFTSGLGSLGEPRQPGYPVKDSMAPGASFRLGTDTLGRDVLTRTLYGTRISLVVAVCAMLTSILIGTTIGLLGGYFGGWVDIVLTRVTESVLSLPTILLAITLFMVIPGDDYRARLFKLLLAISLVTWTGIARAVRGHVLSLKEREFIEAAHALGCSNARIIWIHLLPNVMPTVVVLATLATAHNILLEAGLSYLGVGVEASVPSWGGMIKEGQPFILSAPWIIMAPGVAIVLAVAGFNLLGRALEETLEPRR